LDWISPMLDCDVCMYACYLISVIVVTSFVLGEHTRVT
jgi:hypothetical protein